MTIKFGLRKKLAGTTVIAIGIGMKAAGFGNPAVAHASMTQKEFAEAVRNYQIPQGSMDLALNRLADESGVRMIYRSRLTEKLKTSGLTGSYTLTGALDALLFGTGLHYRLSENGESVSVVLAQAGDVVNDASPRGAHSLPTIDVGATQAPPVPSTARGGGNGRSGAASNGKAALGGRLTGYNAATATSALKMEAPIMQIPVSVQVVTRQTMDDQQAISVKDAVVSNVSGVTLQPSFLEVFKIRGFSNAANTYKNGLIEYAMRALDTTNLQSIEVLKGPAAMLYGRVEPGGIINLVVKRPLDAPYYSLEQQVGSFGNVRTTLDATGPVTADKSILYRFNGEFYRTDSYRNFVSDKNIFIAPTVTLHPIEQFRMNIDFEYQRRDFVDDYALLPASYGAVANIPVSRYLQEPNLTANHPDRLDKKRIAYDWTYDLTKEWSLTNRLSYSNIGNGVIDTMGTGFNPVTGVLNRTVSYIPGYTSKTFSTNLDLKGKLTTGPLSHALLAGFDYFNYFQPLYLGFFSPINTINIYGPAYWQLAANPYKGAGYHVIGQQWTGVYGQDMISFLDDRVHLLLGGRYDWAGYSINSNVNSSFLAEATYATQRASAFSPRVGIAIQPLPWITAYGNFSRSFGANNGLNQGTPLAPQRAEQFEGGVKAEFFDKRLMLSVVYFDLTKTNVPTPDPTNVRNTLLIGKARSTGLEVDLTGQINDQWSVIANYTHDDVRTVSGSPLNPLTEITTQRPVAGFVLAGSPRNYGNIWLKYDVDGMFKGLSLAGGVNASDSFFGDNANSYVLPGYALINGMIAYTTKIEGLTVTAQLNVKNLNNATYYPSSMDRFTVQTGAPRTFLGSLRVEF